MVYCSKCGKKNDNKSKYCVYCGAPLFEIRYDKVKDDDCVCEGNNRNPFVPLFWGLAVILIGLWIIFQFVIPSDYLPSIQDFSFCGLVFLIIALAIILTGFRIITK